MSPDNIYRLTDVPVENEADEIAPGSAGDGFAIHGMRLSVKNGAFRDSI